MILTTIPAAATPTKTDKQLSVRVLHSFGEAESFHSDWNNLVLRAGADVYQSFDWCRLWWHYYGDRRKLHLLLCSSGDELVGLVPAFVETLWLGPVRLRVAKLVGADYTLNLCNLPVLRDVFSSVVSQALHYFLEKQHCDVLLFGPLSGPAARVEELLVIARQENGWVATAEALGDTCNTFFHLPASFDQYLTCIGKQQRGNFKRSLTQIERSHQIKFEVVSSADKLETEFDSFCRLHDAQWKAEGKLGHFGDWPHAERFNRDLVRTLGAAGMVRFHRILADDKLVSSQFSFVFGGTNYWRLPARVSGPEWDKLSLGRMGLAKMIEASLGEGQTIIEGGRGHYAYKLQMGGVEQPLRTVQFIRRAVGVSVRVRCFRAFAAMLDLTYYKVLFMRVAPRVPAIRRPLWPLWIRSQW